MIEFVEMVDVYCRPCMQCATVKKFTLEKDKVAMWRRREAYLQDLFPQLSSIDRESLISGVCSDECWETLTKEPDVVERAILPGS